MRISILLLEAIFLLASCVPDLGQLSSSNQETVGKKPMFYATTETSFVPSTKTFADSQMRVLWNEGDQISIFNKITFNQGFAFDGENGDTAGGFYPVTELPSFGSWGDLDYVYAVYPYNTKNKSDYDGNLTVILPTEQSYKMNSFGIGANTMVAVTTDSRLRFKNVGGYLSIRLYGDNTNVSSVTIEGNNGEKISGKAYVSIPLGGIPTTTMDNSASNSITIVCNPAVQLGADADHYTEFWFVIPPVTFSNGFKVTVISDQGDLFEQRTSRSLTISRNQLDWMNPLKFTPSYIEFADPLVKIICLDNWDTNSDGELSRREAATVTSIGTVFKETAISSFEEFQFFTGLNEICDEAFMGCSQLVSIVIPNNVTRIGDASFSNCGITSIDIPSGVKTIDHNAFLGCSSLRSISIPPSVETLGNSIFCHCSNLTNVELPSSITSIGNYTFTNCSSLTSLVLSDQIAFIGDQAFQGCAALSYIKFGSGLTSIGNNILNPEYLETLVVDPANPVFDSRNNCNALIETATNTLLYGGRNSTIPEGIESIADDAFYGSRINDFTLPSTITHIGERAFSGYNEFKRIHCLAPIPPTLDFDSYFTSWHPFLTGLFMSYQTTISVPSLYYEAYQEAWGSYQNISIEIIE